KNNITYTLDGNKILKQEGNSETEYLTFYYGINGIVGFNYWGTEYYYVKNLQGDVYEIYQDDGGTLSCVAKYEYDAWGNILAITDGNGTDVSNDPYHIANVNPIRYRSYYYDRETNLYYLESRYYDPETGRFLNADNLGYMELETLTGLNLYAYCINNPVMKTDPTGMWTFSINIGVSFFFFGRGFSASVSVTFTRESVALQTSVCSPETNSKTSNDQIGINAGLTVGVQYTELDTVQELEKTPIIASGGDVMLGVDILNDYDTAEYVGWQWNASSLSLDTHKTISETKTVVEIPTINLMKKMQGWME
ncbi:MAG: RHS repeat-associated core domain-containing protein, partial [Clostridia bacterium]|nr:RHS repeat-associated core domain-containing protein [Clostridia bacterium]